MKQEWKHTKGGFQLLKYQWECPHRMRCDFNAFTQEWHNRNNAIPEHHTPSHKTWMFTVFHSTAFVRSTLLMHNQEMLLFDQSQFSYASIYLFSHQINPTKLSSHTAWVPLQSKSKPQRNWLQQLQQEGKKGSKLDRYQTQGPRERSSIYTRIY